MSKNVHYTIFKTFILQINIQDRIQISICTANDVLLHYKVFNFFHIDEFLPPPKWRAFLNNIQRWGYSSSTDWEVISALFRGCDSFHLSFMLHVKFPMLQSVKLTTCTMRLSQDLSLFVSTSTFDTLSKNLKDCVLNFYLKLKKRF